MSTVNMSTPRWKEYTIGVWIVLAVMTGLNQMTQSTSEVGQ